MTIEIKNYDTFSLIKGFLEVYRNSSSTQSYDEAAFILEQMKNVPSTDAIGNFVKDPRLLISIEWDSIAKAEVNIDELVKSYEDIATAVANFWNNIGEAMGPVCYAGFTLKAVLKKHSKPSDWVDTCIKYYEDNWRF